MFNMRPRHLFIAAAFWIALFEAFGCAHVQTVATKCEGEITGQLISVVAQDLAADNYEAALAKVGLEVAPCLIVATVQEIADSLSGSTKAAMALDAVVVQKHAREWLAVHGGAR